MKKIRKWFLPLLCSVTLLWGCGRPAADPTPSPTPTPETPTPSTSESPKVEESFEVSFGHGFMPETPHHQAALMFKEKVETKSNGRLKVTIFPTDQLGSAREQFEGLQLGTQQVALLPTARISGFVPELQLFDLPFLFPDRQTAYKLMDGEVGAALLDKLSSQQVKGVAFYEDGFKHFTANKEIRTVDDFKGLKFRTMESPIIMEQFRVLGANPTPIDFAELYNSLQQGVVDGQENPLVTIKNMKFYEVQDFVILSGHGYLGHAFMFSQNWFDSLPKDLQDILESTGKELAAWQRAEVEKEEALYLEEIKKHGTQVIELDSENKAALRDLTRSVHKLYSDKFGSEILDKAYAEIGQ
ncbi:TRAP transporter substrate-binding protein [Ammoniphilus sp. CFH 90114]|uniref:TRAP transporter substrate-binding protein n=1 Tax=Ammoniphilus sp. CFH 90114 TaxID=2493665 RepID=UPI00100E7B57|nr:TRAP transporter substrate-binding protein [Ammoniphilus sp. CFH 90114]RXT06939.1 TRAP transporter substrate-binding protein [Ammoniphilus sp. CFH 90114]